MSAYPAFSQLRSHVLAIGMAVLLPLSVLARDAVQPESLSVKVLPDMYVAAGTPFFNVEALAASAGPIGSGVLSLESCGAASTVPLLAAVERFHTAYAHGIQIRMLPDETACAGPMGRASDGGVEIADHLPYYPATARAGAWCPSRRAGLRDPGSQWRAGSTGEEGLSSGIAGGFARSQSDSA